MMKKYKGYIAKWYFPKESYPDKHSEVWESFTIMAENRTEAAHKAWKKYGKKWLNEMNPKITKIRHISLYINSPKSGVTGLAGRLTPIRVFSE